MQGNNDVDRQQYYNKIYKSSTGPIRELIRTLIVGTILGIISWISLSIALVTLSLWGKHKVTRFKIWRIRKLTALKVWAGHHLKKLSKFIELDDYFAYIEHKYVVEKDKKSKQRKRSYGM